MKLICYVHRELMTSEAGLPLKYCVDHMASKHSRVGDRPGQRLTANILSNVPAFFQITMSHFEFMIPIQRDDLLEGRDAGGYTVRHVYELAELRSSVHGKMMFFCTLTLLTLCEV